MTVDELLEELQTLPPTARVEVDLEEGRCTILRLSYTGGLVVVYPDLEDVVPG